MTLAWIDCSAGASGDMLLGAFLDAGADLDTVNAAVTAVDNSLSVAVAPTSRHQIAATKASVLVEGAVHREHTGHGHGHTRTHSDVRAVIDRAPLAPEVRDRALDVFARLARAEGTAHGVDPDDVHFHEVGALDAIADIVGVAAAVHSLGLDRIVVSPIALGGGSHARGEHGGVPVPGPAVLALLGEAEAPVWGGEAAYEMTTPTGAALLAALADGFGLMPSMRVVRTGVGAGGRDPVEVPNVLRVVLGEEATVTGARLTTDLVYETNVDDLDPRLWPPVLARLLDAGASDAWLTPILMKKGRPAQTLSVLTDPTYADAVRRVIFAETSAIGLREVQVAKHAAEREFVAVDVAGHQVQVKVARYAGEVVNVQPEYEDVVAAAAALGRPVKSVLAAAVAAAQKLWD